MKNKSSDGSNRHHQSPHYRKKVKKLTEAITLLRGMKRIPNRPQRPARNKDKQKVYDAAFPIQPDKQAVSFYCVPYTFEETRRSQSPSERVETVLKDAIPKDSVKY